VSDLEASRTVASAINKQTSGTPMEFIQNNAR